MFTFSAICDRISAKDYIIYKGVTPIKRPVFQGMATAMGFGEEFLRMPLSPMEDAARAVLLEQMRKLEVIE